MIEGTTLCSVAARRWRSAWIVAAVFFPACALANAGTPLMWVMGLHLFVGNAAIGIGEGLLLTRFFSVRAHTSVPLMILANYASAWTGAYVLRTSPMDALPLNLENGWVWFWALVVVAYFVTLVLEWPFVAFCVRGAQGWWRRSIRASLVVQTASYVVVFGCYWLVSPTSLYTQMHIVAPADLALPETVLVYYLSPADGNVYKRRLTGGGEEKVCELRSSDTNDRLLVRRNAANPELWDLVARLESRHSPDAELVDVRSGLAVEAAPDWQAEAAPDWQAEAGQPAYEGTWFNFGEAPRLGKAAAGEWKFDSGFWSFQGLTATRKNTGERVQFAFATPFGEWVVRNAIALPTDKALFQLGADQICAFDPATRRVALLWRGRGAVAVIQNP